MSEMSRVFAALQHQATSEILHLLDGFYENLEHGLFELAYHLDEPDIQGRCAAMMKELRLQKPKMLRKFTTLMEADVALWAAGPDNPDRDEVLHAAARALSHKHENHFDTVLGSITRCVAEATHREEIDIEIPIGPNRLAYNFLRCFGEAPEDAYLSSMLGVLFERMVLDRLGPLYGLANARLRTSFQPFREDRDGLATVMPGEQVA